MKKLIIICLCLLFATAFVAQVSASPALPITKPPLVPVPSWTGPAQDPDAILGQWFKDLGTGYEHAKPLEFHDNVYEYGGSYYASFLAIEGHVQNIAYDGQDNITGFGIRATITNDTPGIVGSWTEFGNIHGEGPYDLRQPYTCNMYQTKLTVEFADDGIPGNLPAGGAYLPEKNIYAMNYDELGWYCWTPENPDADKVPWGGYIVPTYDFGNIMHWESVTRDLSFGLYNPVDPNNALHQFLVEADEGNWDVFMNRTTSLKISQYVDSILHDTGAAYPAQPCSSDVSVFFIPEPATVCLLGLGALSLIRKRGV